MIRTYEKEAIGAPKRSKYTLSTFKGINTTAAEEILPLNYSPKSYNFCFAKGVLDTGYGVENAYIRTSGGCWQIKRRGISVKFLKFFHYTMHHLNQRSERLVAYGDNGYLYEMTLNELYSGFAPIGEYGAISDAVPYVYNGEDGMLVAATTGLYFLRGVQMTRLSFSEVFSTMCVHSDRVFAVSKLDEYKLYFSDDFDPKNWSIALDEGGYVSFDTEMGKIVKLMSFGGYVYLFFEHGVMRLTAYNSQTDFRLQKVYVSPGTIYPGTIAAMGDRVYFASSEGVFAFDGMSIKKVMTEIEDYFPEDFTGASAVCHGGKYYLACRMSMGSEIASGNNSLVVYDVYRQTTDVAHDLKVLSMISVDLDTVRGVLTEVDYPSDYIGMISKVGRVDATPTVKVWESPVSALGEHSGRKMLREIRVRSTGDGTLTLWLDGKNYEYALSNGMNRVVVMRLFDRMRVTLTFTTAEARVTTCELTVDHYGE